MKITLEILKSAGACAPALDAVPADGWEITPEFVLGMTRDHPDWLAWGLGRLPVEVGQELLGAGADVDTRDWDGWTALMLAARNGHTEIARTLIEAGADVDTQDRNGQTAMMLAAWYGHTEIARALIEAGADVDTRDRDGWTALRAARNGHTEIARALIEAGADGE